MTNPPLTKAGIPKPDCPLCPRLVQFRHDNRLTNPQWYNAPVVSFGSTDSRLLIVGLAPGLKGANRTGRPFTGDFAGDLLYRGLDKFGFSKGRYGTHRDDSLQLLDCRITNAVRCVPPGNKPTGVEIATCRPFLESEIAAMKNLRVLLALGKVAHDSVVRAFGMKLKDRPFRHGEMHSVLGKVALADSYHCSRYNTQTGRLTEAMFYDVLAGIKALTDDSARIG